MKHLTLHNPPHGSDVTQAFIMALQYM